MKYYIYKLTNKTNNKIYIGQTIHFRERMNEHFKYNDTRTEHQMLKRAIKKYGEDNFLKEIIKTVYSKKNANIQEQYYIKHYNSYKPNGYNMTFGGDGGCFTNNINCVLLNLNGQYIDKFNSIREASSFANICEATARDCVNHKIKRVGKYILIKENEYNENNDYKYIRPQSSRKIKIVQLDNNGNLIKEFNSLTEASLELNINRNNITSSIIKKTLCNNFIFMYLEKYIKNGCSKYFKNGRRKYLIVQKKDNIIINKFKSFVEATYNLGLPYNCYKTIQGSISKNCNAYGYKWEREEV